MATAIDLRRAVINRWHAGASNSEEARRLMHTLVQGDIRIERSLQIDQQGLNGIKVAGKVLDEILSAFIPDTSLPETKIPDLKDDLASDRQTLRKSLVDAYFEKDRENNYEFVSMYLEADIDAECFARTNSVTSMAMKIVEKCGALYSSLISRVIKEVSAQTEVVPLANVPPPSPLRRSPADAKPIEEVVE
jgi:hypothetical protein